MSLFDIFKKSKKEEPAAEAETTDRAAEEADEEGTPELDEVLSEVGEVLDAMEDSEVALEALDADLAAEDEEWETVILPADIKGEVLVLEDGRTFDASFVREIRALDAPDLRVILDEQKDLYTEEEYAYIEEVMAERLGDIH